VWSSFDQRRKAKKGEAANEDGAGEGEPDMLGAWRRSEAMSNVELTGVILAVAGIIISVLLALRSNSVRKQRQTQKGERGSINFQSGRDTNIK
jgi:hypothetical protein